MVYYDGGRRRAVVDLVEKKMELFYVGCHERPSIIAVMKL